MDALPPELARNLATQQLLKLIRLHAKYMRPKPPTQRRSILDHGRRRSARYIRLHMSYARRIDPHEHVSRVVAAPRVPALARIQRNCLHREVSRPCVKPDVL